MSEAGRRLERVRLGELDEIVDVGECEPGDGVGGAVVDRQAPRSASQRAAHGKTTLGTSPMHSYGVCGEIRYGFARAITFQGFSMSSSATLAL